MSVDSSVDAPSRHWALVLFGIILALIGAALLVRGASLAMLGGSWYYVIVGVLLIVSGVLYARRRVAGAWLYALVFVGTLIWAVWEVGFAFWPLVPRLAPVIVLGLIAALLLPALTYGRVRKGAYTLAVLLLLALIGGGAAMFQPQGVLKNQVAAAQPGTAPASASQDNWQFYGRTPAGTRYTPAAQINRENVSELEVAWTFQTGEVAEKGSEFQNTPTQIGDTVYVCTPLNKVFALDADTGAQRWVYDPQVKDNKFWNRCRGVGYYEPGAVQNPVSTPLAAPADGMCAQRIVLTTADARLIQLDAKTGEVCKDFADNGAADLLEGLGEVKDQYYMPTSMPTVVRDLVVIGGWVWDGKETNEPSGVVRAFSANTGELVWAWDLGNPDITKLPPEGETYTRGTPNMWSTPAFDDELGLVYLPLGNGTPDFWGAHRTEAMNEYASSVVAVDVATGRERWKFQTVHYDTWDYDVGSQPTLYDIPDGKGGVTPALLQTTKTGQIYALDRRDGTPIRDVQEKPVPQKHDPGDNVAPTQPFSVGMPAFGGDVLTEKDMWGATFFDQLECRIAFKKLNYEGPFTPILADQTTLIYPGYYGGMNWGSNAVDESQGVMIINDIRMPQIALHIPPEKASPEAAKAFALDGAIHTQSGTPYSTLRGGFYSPLGVPCHAPPWGTISGVDLKSGELMWQRPAGTIEDTVVSGVKASLPIPLGMPTLGGPLATEGGLAFYAGTQDYYLRAYDVITGDELWKGRLPVGAQAGPLSYVSPASGRQYVVIAAGGARQSPDRGDYVVAYALPKK